MYRILIVDDSADNLLLMQAFLEIEGYQVETAVNGQEALQKAEDYLPHLMLLDVVMPGMNGFEVTQRIRQNKHLHDVPILLLTGHNEKVMVKGLELGANGFVYKPFDSNELLNTIQAFCQPNP
jgi:CheY-like chemotaxis protein